MKFIIILILIYIASLSGAYKFIQQNHSKHGKWNLCHIGIFDICVTILPIINTYFCISECISRLPKLSEGALDKFYKIQK